MAGFTERIKIIVDVVTDGAKAGLSGFKSAVDEAEGAGGKFKAGMSSAFDTVKANAGALAIGAGAALVAFGVKAVGAFTDTAKAAIDLSTATGLGTEEASRWIGVADDYKVSAEALATGLGKVSKTLDDTKWADYGIATRDASGEARSANDILLDSFDMLSKITNKTEQARVGQELFGKGYQSLTPILGHTREEYVKMLGSVEKGQVITEEEAAKAEKMRLAQDQLSDALKEVGLSFGGLLTEIAPVVVKIAETVGWVVKLTEKAADLGLATKDMTDSNKEFADSLKGKEVYEVINSFQKLVTETGNARTGIDKTRHGFNDFFTQLAGGNGEGLRNFNKTFGDLARQSPEAAAIVISALEDIVYTADNGGKKAQDLVDKWGLSSERIKELAASIPGATQATKDLNDANKDGIVTADELKAAQDAAIKTAEEQKTASDNLSKGIENLTQSILDEFEAQKKAIRGQLDAVGSTGDLEQQVRDVASGYYDLQQQIIENDKTQADSKVNDGEKEQSQRDLETAIHDHAAEVYDLAQKYADEKGAVDGSKQQHDLMLDALNLNKAKYPELASEIDKYIAKLNSIPTTVTTQVTINSRGDVTNAGLKGARASGGDVDSGDYLVGEHGPEIAHFDRPGHVFSNTQSRHMVSGDTYVTNVYQTLPPGLDPQAVAKASRIYARRGGR